MFILNAANAATITACLRVACELDVAETLREVGSEGLHVERIAPGKVNSDLLARVLGLLATHHIFREVTPNVFANLNRISAALDKGKTQEELGCAETRPADASGPAAVVELLQVKILMAEENMKMVAFLGEVTLTTQENQRNLPFNHVFRTDETFYAWIECPENAWRRQRFGFAMDATAAWEPPHTILTGFDWSTLPAGSLVVDVGGGNGNTSMQIARTNPSLRIIVQDLDSAIKGAKLHWQSNFPSHIDNKMVSFQGV